MLDDNIALRVRFPPLENTDMVMKVLSNSTQCLVGQPHYLAQLPKGFDPQLLGTLPSVHWGSAQREYQWELFQGEDNSRSIVIPHTPRMVTADLFEPASLTRALDGMDVAYYLVHSMARGEGYRERDLAAARP